MTTNEEQILAQAKTLGDHAVDNVNFFTHDMSVNGRKLLNASLELGCNLVGFAEKLVKIQKESHRFDFDELTPANGYRSYVKVGVCALDYGINLTKKIIDSRNNFFFRKSKYAKHLHSYSQLLYTLQSCFRCLEQILTWSSTDNLIIDEENKFLELLTKENMDLHCFYGRCMGFQFSDEMKRVFNNILTAMTVYSTYFLPHESFFAKVIDILLAPKYFVDEEARAVRLITIFQNATTEFCRSFWNFSEIIQFSYGLAVNQVVTIASEALSLDVDGREINVPVPTAHLGEKSIQARLISNIKYKGMIETSENDNSLSNPSKKLIIHCHSGGYVALSSRAHIGYLRRWTKELDVPILSIDYSLAPEAPYPRALEEVFYVYCWALKNKKLLGTTGERIILVGDSSGGNIILAATLKCIALGIPLPNGLCPIYANIGKILSPSPSRFLSIMDPLLPFTFLLICIRAYICGIECATYCVSQDAKIKNEPNYDLTYNISEAITSTSGIETVNEDEIEIKQCSTKISIQVTPDPTYNEPSTPSIKSSLEKKEEFTSIEFLESLPLDETSFNFAKFMQFPNPANNPYLCPLLAKDADLKKFPPVIAVTATLDPFLDDNIMFCKKLRKLGNNVDLEVLPNLGHGFLNLTYESTEAIEGCNVVIKKMSELLELNNPPQEDSTSSDVLNL